MAQPIHYLSPLLQPLGFSRRPFPVASPPASHPAKMKWSVGSPRRRNREGGCSGSPRRSRRRPCGGGRHSWPHRAAPAAAPSPPPRPGARLPGRFPARLPHRPDTFARISPNRRYPSKQQAQRPPPFSPNTHAGVRKHLNPEGGERSRGWSGARYLRGRCWGRRGRPRRRSWATRRRTAPSSAQLPEMLLPPRRQIGAGIVLAQLPRELGDESSGKISRSVLLPPDSSFPLHTLNSYY
jgi:hypothetical protein